MILVQKMALARTGHRYLNEVMAVWVAGQAEGDWLILMVKSKA